MLAAAAVGLRGGTSSASGVGAPRVRHKQKHLVQKDGGGLGMLTMHWIGRRVVAGRPAMRLRGGIRGGARGQVGAGLLRASGRHGATLGGSAKRYQGSGGIGDRRRRGIEAAQRLTGGDGPNPIPAMQGSRPEKGCSRSLLGLRRSYRAAWPGLRCDGAAWPRRHRGAARGGAAWRRLLGIVQWLWGEIGCRGSRGGLKGLAEDLGMGSERKVRRGSWPGISGVMARTLRCGGEGAARWARLVSEMRCGAG